MPERAVEVDLFLALGQEFDRDMCENIVLMADQESGFSRHCRVNGVSGEKIAQDGVFSVGRNATDEITRVEIAEYTGQTLSLEVFFDALPQINADVVEFWVARLIEFLFSRRKKVLPRAFGDKNDGMFPAENAHFQGAQKAVLAVENEGNFGHQREIHILARDRCARCDEASIAPHDFHERDAVLDAVRFRMRAVDDFRDFLDGG